MKAAVTCSYIKGLHCPDGGGWELCHICRVPPQQPNYMLGLQWYRARAVIGCLCFDLCVSDTDGVHWEFSITEVKQRLSVVLCPLQVQTTNADSTALYRSKNKNTNHMVVYHTERNNTWSGCNSCFIWKLIHHHWFLKQQTIIWLLIKIWTVLCSYSRLHSGGDTVLGGLH